MNKKLILLLTILIAPLVLLVVSLIDAKPLGVDITTNSCCNTTPTPTASPSTSALARQVTFVFSSDFVGTVAGACFAGTAGVCGTNRPADLSFTMEAPAGDTINSIPYTITAGSLRVIRSQ